MLILCFRCWLWTKLTHFPAQWTFTNSWAFFLFFIAHLEQVIIPWLVSSNVSARRFHVKNVSARRCHVKNLIWKSLQNLQENVCHRFLLSKVADRFTIGRHHWAKLQEASLQGDPTEQSYRQLHYRKTPLSKVAGTFTIGKPHWAKLQVASLQKNPIEQSCMQRREGKLHWWGFPVSFAGFSGAALSKNTCKRLFLYLCGWLWTVFASRKV